MKGGNDEEMKAKIGKVLRIYFHNIIIIIVKNDWCKKEKGEDVIFRKRWPMIRRFLISIGPIKSIQEQSTPRLTKRVNV